MEFSIPKGINLIKSYIKICKSFAQNNDRGPEGALDSQKFSGDPCPRDMS